MSMSVNKVILMGFVGNDPEVTYPEKNMVVVRFSLATNERQGTSGTELTEWHNIVISGANGPLAERYIRKGTRIYLEGKLRTREYIDRFKINRKRTEIIVTFFEIVGRSKE